MRTPKEIIKIGQLELRFFLDGDDANGQMTMFEFIIPAGAMLKHGLVLLNNKL
ncbi:MAG: hypothetical protein ABIN91_05265 [Mucilaginibacter sp.]|uniref:hypothetical protein n=1 Tax=Mucilaginibacter sp. TaxID=1882438 RepID=UPI003263D582